MSAEATWSGSAPAQIKRGTQLAGGTGWVWRVKDCGDYGDSTGPCLNDRAHLIDAYAAYRDDGNTGRVCHDLKLGNISARFVGMGACWEEVPEGDPIGTVSVRRPLTPSDKEWTDAPISIGPAMRLATEIGRLRLPS